MQVSGVVENVSSIDVGKAREIRASRRINEGLEIQAVSKLVQKHSYEVGLGSMVIVQAQIEVEIATELGVDVGESWIQLKTSPLIG
jgi:hypothetical protein